MDAAQEQESQRQLNSIEQIRASTALAEDFQNLVSRLRQGIGLSGDMSVLAIGCGIGVCAIHFDSICRVVCMDVSREMLVENPVARRVVMDARQLGFADSSFDVVLAHHSLHHIEPPLQALREMARVSRRYVVVVDLNILNPVNFGFLAIGAEDRKWAYFTCRGLRQLMSAAGLRVVGLRTYGILSPYLMLDALVPLQKALRFEHPLGLEHLAIGVKV
ncbi:class I SAM-dependent methyltransferase [Chloroflexota bacterium]